MGEHNTYKWWKEAVGYQIYPKTFFDANNDGYGDIQGIIDKLPYLRELGIDFIWICPFFDSPLDDNGYDIRNYYKVHENFGNMQDIKTLIAKAKEMGIRIIVDLVLNHTSDEHEWFVNVKKHSNSMYRDYYILKEGKAGKPPNNWGSFFGGSAWEKLNDKEYYLKLFSKKMPDLNWSNRKLRTALYQIASWWLDLGVDGFRIDAIAHIAKDTSYKDSTLESDTEFVSDWSKFSNLPRVHEYIKEFHEEVLEPNNAFAVGEVGGDPSVEDVLKYCAFDRNELDVTFTFDHMWCNNINEASSLTELKTNVKELKETLEHWQVSLIKKAWYPLYWNNHDFNRLVSNYGSVKYPQQSAKALATLMYGMWGTMFIYQGEEIGMENYPFTSIDQLEDVQAKGQYEATPLPQREKFLRKLFMTSRDNMRTVMQWDDTKNAGFSSAKPSMLLNPNYKRINVKQQMSDPNSVWHYYKKIIHLKKSNMTFIYGDIVFADVIADQVIQYARFDDHNRYLVVVNLGENDCEIEIPAIQSIVLSNVKTTKPMGNILKLSAFDSYIFKVK